MEELQKQRRKVPPSIAWSGFIGINADSEEAWKRFPGFVFQNFYGEGWQ